MLAEALTTAKVYQVNDCDWVAARSPEEARAFMIEWHGLREDPHEEVCWLVPREVTAVEMQEFLFHDPDHMLLAEKVEPAKMSFRAALEIYIRSGERPPFFFASTEY